MRGWCGCRLLHIYSLALDSFFFFCAVYCVLGLYTKCQVLPACHALSAFNCCCLHDLLWTKSVRVFVFQ
jgi:hypothetical protein